MTSGQDVLVVRTGTANMASILVGLQRAGGCPVTSDDPEEVEAAQAVVLPGVGTFGAAMKRLRECHLLQPLRERIEKNKPTLAVCVGLQVLAESSEESPGETGLGHLPCQIKRFPDSVRVPHFGWNSVEVAGDSRFLEKGHAYFANSYRLTSHPDGWCCGLAEHGGSFVAAVERGKVLGCQFHPELSGEWGIRLMGRWLENARVATC